MRNSHKYIMLSVVAIIIIILSLTMGSTFVSPMQIIKAIYNETSTDDLKIVLLLRMPRILMAIIIGASLAVSGVIFQAILKNPIAEPFLIGVSSGAALGASIAIVLMLSSIYIALGAFTGSVLTAYFVFIISKRKNFGSSSLILSGISLSFVLWSTVLLVFAFSPAKEVHKALLWLMGDLSIARYTMLSKAFPFCIIIIVFSYIYHRHLNIIAFGDEFASSAGISNQNVKNLFWISSLLAAISVALAGVIGFVGLIIPHIVRLLFSSNHKYLLGLSALVGAVFLLFCDLLSRTIALPYEIPIGVITGFFGGFFFLFLMIKGGIKE